MILLNESTASVFVKDNEYFFNPIEWTIYLNKDNKALNPFLDNSMTTFESIKSPTYRNKTIENLETLNNANNLIKSHTNMSFNSDSSLNIQKGSQINYKTWYGVPNPYYESQILALSKCEHITYKNYSVDHQNSTFTPAIFTPRKTSRSSQRSTNTQDMTIPTYEEDDTQNLLKLIDKLQEKMSNTYSNVQSSLPSSAMKSFVQTSAHSSNNNKQLATQSSVEHSPVFVTSSATTMRSSNSQFKDTQKRTLQKFILKQQEGIFLPDISNTAKILALTPQSKTTIKDGIHNIFECYTIKQPPFINTTRNKIDSINRNESSLKSHSNRSSPDSTVFMETNSKLPEQKSMQANNSLKKPNKGIMQRKASSELTNTNKSKEVKFILKNK